MLVIELIGFEKNLFGGRRSYVEDEGVKKNRFLGYYLECVVRW